MLPTERIDYSPIHKRPPLKLPDGARMVVWSIVNIEEWDARETMPRTVLTPPAGGSPSPDVPNWAWHEYGNRVGFWRMLEIFDALRIKIRDEGHELRLLPKNSDTPGKCSSTNARLRCAATTRIAKNPERLIDHRVQAAHG